MKPTNLRRLATLMFLPAVLVTPVAAYADENPLVENAAPKVDAVVNSPDAVAEKAQGSDNSVVPLPKIKARAAEQIAKRHKSLTDWSGDIAKAKGDCGQNAGAATRIATTQASLNTLAPQIQAAADVATAKPLYEQIFTHHRVYLVVGPAVHIPLACGAQSARAARILTEVANVQTAIEAAKANGIDTTAASALVASVKPLVDGAKAESIVASNSVASIVPDLGNEAIKTANATTVKTARDQIKSADVKLDAAAKALKDARESLRGAKKSDHESDKAEKDADKAEKKAEKEADKAEKKAEKEADKAEKKAEKTEKKAERTSKQAERKAKR